MTLYLSTLIFLFSNLYSYAQAEQYGEQWACQYTAHFTSFDKNLFGVNKSHQYQKTICQNSPINQGCELIEDHLMLLVRTEFIDHNGVIIHIPLLINKERWTTVTRRQIELNLNADSVSEKIAVNLTVKRKTHRNILRILVREQFDVLNYIQVKCQPQS